MSLITVGVLRGGPSNEYDVSLATGANMLKALREKFVSTYLVKDILISKDGKWHIDGMGKKPEEILAHIDVALLALHGTYGEDGKVQHILEAFGTPFTGSGSLASAVAMNKDLSKKAFAAHGIKVASDKIIESSKIKKDPSAVTHEIFKSFSMPAVVKPVSSGSSVGMSLVKTAAELEKGLIEAAKHSDMVMVEEYIKGVEVTIGVIEKFRGEELYALPPVEIRLDEAVVPATFSQDIKKEISELGRSVHTILGLRHYSSSDFIIHPRRGIYVLEVNTLPSFANKSHIVAALQAVGSDTPEFLDHLLQSVL